jgi:hypothetical protein
VEPVAEDKRGIKRKHSEIFGHDSKPCRYCRLSSYDVVFIARQAAIIDGLNTMAPSKISRYVGDYSRNQKKLPTL